MTILSSEELMKIKTITLHGEKGKPYTMRNYPDVSFYGNLPTAGESKMPVLKPFSGYIPNRIVPFDEAYTKKDKDCIVHFYENDRRFMRLFHNPTKYLSFLRKCAVVVGPDLSQLAYMDETSRFFHAWHNRAMSAWLQQNGVNIIPNVTWSRRDSFEYSYDGMPKQSIIAVNCTGILDHDISMYMWREGYKNVVLPLEPSIIIRYGDKMPGEKEGITLHYNNDRLNRLRHGS